MSQILAEFLNPVVLVQNPVIVKEVYDWKDIEGEQYHFLNQYKNLCRPGVPFVYYRGTRRPRRKRAAPEYFGHGRIGTVWRDESIPQSQPKKDWAWYCAIQDYEPFSHPVPAKIDGEFLETIPRNFWGVGVRRLPLSTHKRILKLAGIADGSKSGFDKMPDTQDVTIDEAVGTLLVPREASKAPGVSVTAGSRYSKKAAIIGRRAEEIVHRYLTERSAVIGVTNLRWPAREGRTPGWDLEYEGGNGELIAIEVKGSAGPMFGSIEVTVGEWDAAKRLADHYWLYLVGNCCGTHPIVQPIQNPARLLAAGAARLDPVVYRFSAVKQG